MTSLLEDDFARSRDDYLSIIETQSANENLTQAFLESNTRFLPTPNLLNHQLHFRSIIRKMPIGDYKTDYAYLTKSSTGWRLVLVELEDSSKKIFTSSKKNPTFSANFSAAKAQVDTWRRIFEKDEASVRARLDPLIWPLAMKPNTIRLHRVLVYGRSLELEKSEAKRQTLEAFEKDNGITVLTYDSVLRMAELSSARPKAILRSKSTGFELVSAQADPEHMFAYVGPEFLDISDDAESQLLLMGYHLGEWRKGELLTVNGKYAKTSDPERVDHAFTKRMLERQDGNGQ